jgi:pentatricopeptide repeat protein
MRRSIPPLRLGARVAALQQRLVPLPASRSTEAVDRATRDKLSSRLADTPRGTETPDRQRRRRQILAATWDNDDVAVQKLSPYLRCNDAQGAFAAWVSLTVDEVWPDGSLLKELLIVCTQAGDWRRARSVLNQSDAPKPGGGSVATDVRHWNVVLGGIVRAGELREAEALLDEMMRAVGTSRAPDTVSFNTLLHGYLPSWAGGEADEARVRRADKLVAQMHGMGVPRDATTYEALISLHWLDPQRVTQLLADSAAGGVQLEVRTYTKVTRALWWAQKPDQAWKILAMMRQAGLEPDADYYATAIAAATSVNLFDDADRLHREAVQLNLGSALAAELAKQSAPRHAQSLYYRPVA